MSEFDPRRFGMAMVRAGLIALGAFLVGAGGWLIWQAVIHPEIRLKRPRWIEDSAVFNHAYWTPLLVVVLGGAVLVGSVLWRAYRRLDNGEDLYAQRHGKGLRRRGERHLGAEEKTSDS
jgi:hypothetical protein